MIWYEEGGEGDYISGGDGGDGVGEGDYDCDEDGGIWSAADGYGGDKNATEFFLLYFPRAFADLIWSTVQ